MNSSKKRGTTKMHSYSVNEYRNDLDGLLLVNESAANAPRRIYNRGGQVIYSTVKYAVSKRATELFHNTRIAYPNYDIKDLTFILISEIEAASVREIIQQKYYAKHYFPEPKVEAEVEAETQEE